MTRSDQIRAAYAEGRTLHELAREFRLPQSEILRALDRAPYGERRRREEARTVRIRVSVTRTMARMLREIAGTKISEWIEQAIEERLLAVQMSKYTQEGP